MTDASSATDQFAAARGNLRDTIKWLITALAALAAAVLGSSPLTGFGTLGPGLRLIVAIATGSAGLALVLIAIYKAFRLLVGQPLFLSDMTTNAELHDFIEQHAADLLPPECQKLDDLLRLRNNARETLQRTAREAENQERARAKQFMDESDPVVDRLLNLAHYEKLRRELLAAGKILFALAIGAVVCLGAFAWAANPVGKTSPPTHATSTH
jgi:hypothetical protein